MKQLVKEKYDDFKDWLIQRRLVRTRGTTYLKIINDIVNFMMKEDPEKWDWFCEYTRQIDKLRTKVY